MFSTAQAEKNLMAVELLKFVVEEMSRRIHSQIMTLSVPPGRVQFLREVGLDKME
jgi:hypothetical protein